MRVAGRRALPARRDCDCDSCCGDGGPAFPARVPRCCLDLVLDLVLALVPAPGRGTRIAAPGEAARGSVPLPRPTPSRARARRGRAAPVAPDGRGAAHGAGPGPGDPCPCPSTCPADDPGPLRASCRIRTT